MICNPIQLLMSVEESAIPSVPYPVTDNRIEKM